MSEFGGLEEGEGEDKGWQIKSDQRNKNKNKNKNKKVRFQGMNDHLPLTRRIRSMKHIPKTTGIRIANRQDYQRVDLMI